MAGKKEEKTENGSGHMRERRLSTRELPRERQFEALRDAMSENSVPVKLDMERPDEGFVSDVLVRGFGSLLLSYASTCTETRNVVSFRHERPEIARTREHALILWCHLGESHAITYNGASRMMGGAGGWCLFNTEDRITGTCHAQRGRQVVVRIPGKGCAPLLQLGGRAIGMPRSPDSLPNALVRNYLETLARYPMPGPEQSIGIGRHLVDIITLAANQTQEQFEASASGVRAALTAAVEREIEVHYLDLELSPASVAASLRITPRYLHKLLEPSGVSFSERVMQRRLQHAQTLLAAPAAARPGILSVALDSGFRNAEHFSQRFRAAFGITPSDFRDCGAARRHA